MSHALHDCRIALRGFATMTACAATAALALALGIGGTTATSSVVYADPLKAMNTE